MYVALIGDEESDILSLFFSIALLGAPCKNGEVKKWQHLKSLTSPTDRFKHYNLSITPQKRSDCSPSLYKYQGFTYVQRQQYSI